MSAAAPSAIAPNPQTNPNALPGSLAQPAVTPAGAAGVPQVDTSPMFSLPSNEVLPNVPIFPAPTPGAYTDAQYLAQEAALRYSIAKQYQDVLSQLGYVDPATGKTIQGQIAIAANIKAAQLQHDLAQESIMNDRQRQNEGTIFSGIRGTELAQAQYPTVQGLGELGLNTTDAMSKSYQGAQDLITQYNLQNNQLLADAANRQLGNITANPGGTPPASGGAGGAAADTSGTPPPADTSGMPAAPAGQALPPESAPAGPNVVNATRDIFMADGAAVTEPTRAVVGEKGPEVVIPLSKLSNKSQLKLLHLADEAGIYTEAIKRMAGV